MIKLKDLYTEAITQHDSIIETWLGCIPACDALGNKTFLTRGFQGLRKFGALVTPEDPLMGRMSLAFGEKSYFPEIAAIFASVRDTYGLDNVVYCSHGKSKFALGGRQYICIPKTPYKTIWSPDVHDIYADSSELLKQGRISEFPLSSYRDTWPVGDVDEVLLDCDSYYLISLKHQMIDYAIYKGGVNPTTYSELSTLLKQIVEPHRHKYTNIDSTGINTPGDPDQ